jgi:hypothetical protein
MVGSGEGIVVRDGKKSKRTTKNKKISKPTPKKQCDEYMNL